jgi:SAM-dependent methyltransferase
MTSSTAASRQAMLFEPVTRCWICGGASLSPFHEYRFDFHEYATQDPELDAYTGQTGRLVHCRACGFGQPEALPTLPRFFDRMYDQRWSPDWIASEFESTYKDFIFRSILRVLDRRAKERPRRLLDIGAHAGRFLHLARLAGWDVEGIELNPRTAAYAASRTHVQVHQVNAHALAGTGARFHAITLTDVLEHIPEPVTLLTTAARMLSPGGSIAVKVPCGRSQWRKERLLAALLASREVSLAGNLVHVNHFTPRSLALALRRAGFADVHVSTAAPELMPLESSVAARFASNALRLGVYAAARIPGGVQTPLALNLQAYATLVRPNA